MKRKIFTVIIFILGVIILLYPFVSKIISLKNQTVAITNYNKKVESLTVEQKKELIDEHEKYNKDLYENNNFRVNFSEQENKTSYINLLSLGEMIGYIEIDKININIPIYEGSNTEVLTNGIGHMQNTSLPCGGINTHSVLVGHTGLAKAKMFDDLDKLNIDDTFSIHYLDQELVYKIYDIRIVKPDETECLQIQEGEDLITLVTCTPKYVNTHRLLVTGKRILNNENFNTNNETVEEQDKKQETYKYKNIIIILVIVIIIILFSMFIYINKKLNLKGEQYEKNN